MTKYATDAVCDQYATFICGGKVYLRVGALAGARAARHSEQVYLTSAVEKYTQEWGHSHTTVSGYTFPLTYTYSPWRACPRAPRSWVYFPVRVVRCASGEWCVHRVVCIEGVYVEKVFDNKFDL